MGQEPVSSGSTVIDFGLAEFYTIPAEVAPLLPMPKPLVGTSTPQIEEEVRGDAGTFSREAYVLWSYVWQHTPSLLRTDTLSKRDLRALADQFPRELKVDEVKREDELPRLYFQRMLLQTLGLIERHGDVLRADPESARERWEQPLAERARDWLASYQSATWWQELNWLPQVNWQTYQGKYVDQEWLRARGWVIEQVGGLGAEAEWVAYSSFLLQLRLLNRNFLVPAAQSNRGYYGYGANYHRYTTYGNTRQWGFTPVTSESDGWTKVEGGFVVAVLEVLNWLGLVDLGQSPKGSLRGFRLTALGRHLLAGRDAPAEEPREGGRVVVQPNFHIVAFGPVGERQLLELERFADRLNADRAIEYEITRQSLYRAQRAGMTAQEVLARLRELMGMELPQNVVRSLEEWQQTHERITIRRSVTLLQGASSELLDTIQGAAEGALRPLSPTMAVIKEPAALQGALQKLDLSAVLTHDPEGRSGLMLDEEGVVSFRHRVPDIYLLGQVQRLAEWDEEAERWHLTRGAVQRAKNQFKMEADAQIAAWKTLLIGALPPWLPERIKAWSGHYGDAALHRVVLLEFQDKDTLSELRRDKQLARKIKAFHPRGVLATVHPDDLDELRALLAEYGIEVKE